MMMEDLWNSIKYNLSVKYLYLINNLYKNILNIFFINNYNEINLL
jgi:hypothetical protein